MSSRDQLRAGLGAAIADAGAGLSVADRSCHACVELLAVLEAGVRGVFALPVAAAGTTLGALDLYCHDPGALTDGDLAGGLWVSALAALPLLDLMTADVDWSAADEGGDGWEQLASLERVEAYQATGMLIDHLGVDPAEALIRLRAHAFARGMTASEVAWAILDHRNSLDDDHPWRRPGGGPGDTS